MSTVKQKFNSRVMQQKAEKAQRLLREVVGAVEARGVVHELWETVKTHATAAAQNCDNVLNALESIHEYNRQIEEKRI